MAASSRPGRVRSGQLLKGHSLARVRNDTFTRVCPGLPGFAWLAFFQFYKLGFGRNFAGIAHRLELVQCQHRAKRKINLWRYQGQPCHP